ncbi:phage virion morphogenesis protein [Sphingomonas aracearum]|uniref:Phage virion morphogenesis protein n=1 Tax=Sphingomonas aracearum TaxID=2283317 RepID=A0A369VS37_9SPHN|nr:phage virion morphogenesis protein [Sphingomonas aracearum]RDE04689.1 phage virion morphogenesis protein [Sphingomonas aracearum]
MTDDFAPVEQLAGALLRSLSPAERRSLLRRMAREIRASQSDRIAAQRNPDGSPFAARRERREQKPGTHAVRFLYPKGAAEPRVVFMKSWVRQGPLLTGFDTEAGAIRSFFWDKVAQWLPVAPEEQNAGAGKLRRRGQIRRRAMFRKLRSARYLRSDATDTEAWIGFTGRAAEVARIHQDGLMDAPTLGARKIRYAQRGLLGLTERERGRALDILLEHVSKG